MDSLSRCPGKNRPPNRSINSLCFNGIIWRHRSIMAQVMACCLTASSHYRNQCWLIVCEILRHYLRLISQKRLKKPILVMSLKITHLRYQPGFNELTHWLLQSLLSLSISYQAKQVWINHWNGWKGCQFDNIFVPDCIKDFEMKNSSAAGDKLLLQLVTNISSKWHLCSNDEYWYHTWFSTLTKLNEDYFQFLIELKYYNKKMMSQ